MAEREYYDLDDYLRAGGDPSYGQAVSAPVAAPVDPYTPPGPAPLSPTGTATPTSTPAPYDPTKDKSKPPAAVPGWEWYWTDTDGWRARPTSGPGPGPAPLNTATGSSFSYTPNWPTYDAPDWLSPGAFDPGTPFTFEDFTYQDFSAPTAESMLNDDGFKFRIDQGRKALEASAAGRGTLRSGGTLKDILQYGQNFASQEYGNVYNRALQEYDTNRSNKFGTYQTKRQNAWDNYTTAYGGRKDAYTFQADDMNRQNLFNQNNAQFDYTGRQRQVQSELDDAFRRWSQEGTWLTNLGGD